MHFKRILLILMVMIFMTGTLSAEAAPTTPAQELVNLPYTKEIIDANEPGVTNLSVALVGAYEIPFISYTKSDDPYIHFAHLATAAVPGNCPSNDAWVCDYFGWTDIVYPSLSNVATYRYGPDTYGLAWAFQKGTHILGLKDENFNDMRHLASNSETLIDISKFGGILVGAPSIELVGSKFRLAAVFRDNYSPTTYQLVYLHYVGGSHTSCSSVASPYQCDVIETSATGPIGAPSLAYAAGDVGIAYTKGNAVRYAYPWGGMPTRPSNCGPGGNTWRCIDIVNPVVGTIGDRVALDFGSAYTHAAIAYNYKPTTKDFLMSAIYVGSGGDCGEDGYVGTTPTHRWLCGSDLDAFIEDINQTTFAVTFDPNDYPVFSWNNQFVGDTAQRLYVKYPAARTGTGGGWIKQVIDGNDWSSTGKWNDIAISNAGLTFLGYMQPSYRSCGDVGCPIDLSDNLKAAMQRFKTYLPVINK